MNDFNSSYRYRGQTPATVLRPAPITPTCKGCLEKFATENRNAEYCQDKLCQAIKVKRLAERKRNQRLKRLGRQEEYTLCKLCGQPMLPPGHTKEPNQYDHAQGCPDAGKNSQGKLIEAKRQRQKA